MERTYFEGRILIIIGDSIKAIMEQLHLEKLDPLDGDETEKLAGYFKNELDWQNGNITAKEWAKQLEVLHKSGIIR